ncbi:MAG TPA: hypothetical protein VGC57_02135 [Cellulomonas sp.]
MIDPDAGWYAAAAAAWFRAAGIGHELGAALYAVESDVAPNPFAEDVATCCSALHDSGVRVGVLSDLRVDLRQRWSRTGSRRVLLGGPDRPPGVVVRARGGEAGPRIVICSTGL